jgi:hypothetical protein
MFKKMGSKTIDREASQVQPEVYLKLFGFP